MIVAFKMFGDRTWINEEKQNTNVNFETEVIFVYFGWSCFLDKLLNILLPDVTHDTESETTLQISIINLLLQFTRGSSN